MIERKFEAAEAPETVGFSHGDSSLVVQTLDNSAGKQLLSAEIVEDLAMMPSARRREKSKTQRRMRVSGERGERTPMSAVATAGMVARKPQSLNYPEIVGNAEEFCKPPVAVDDDVLDGLPCSAGHTARYVSPYGDVYPCVRFPLPCGNVRTQRFLDIWRLSSQLKEVRSIRARDLEGCSQCGHLGSCTRCPGLAYMEGNMRGPSSADCEKSFARTGILTSRMRRPAAATDTFVRIRG